MPSPRLVTADATSVVSLQTTQCIFEASGQRISGDVARIIAESRSVQLTQWVLRNAEVISFGDVDSDIARHFVRYLETGRVTLTLENAARLCAIARRYHVHELRQRCERFIALSRPESRLMRGLDRGWHGVLHAVESIASWWGTAALHARGFHSSRIATSVGRVHVFETRGRGEGPPVVVLHGLSAKATDYSVLLRALVPVSKRIIAPDLPGHGMSDRAVASSGVDAVSQGLWEALDQLITDEPVVLFGNSMGGFAAMRYAARCPEKVRALILSSPGGAPMDEEEIQALLDGFRMESHAEALTFLDRLFAGRPPIRRFLAEAVRAHFRDPELRELMAHARAEDMLSLDELSRLTMPTLLIWGKQERILPHRHLKFFRDHLPNVTIEEPDGYGHFPLFDDARGFSQRVRAYVASLR